MSSEWEESDSDNAAPAPAKPSKAAATAPKKKKWEGEDEDDGSPASDWEESSEEEKPPPPPSSTASAPIKKKGTLKQKLAEKEAEKARRTAEGDDDDVYDSDDVLDPRAKAKRDRERELNADLSNARDLLGSAAAGGTSSKELDSIISLQPRTKEQFEKLSALIMEHVMKQHQSKPIYPHFVEYHARQLAESLKDVEVRKVASGLTTLANEKQKEQREKTSGKKKKPAKPALGGAKASSKYDTNAYDEALDDFGSHADDFM